MRKLEGMLIGKNALYHYVDGARKLACNVKCALCGDMSEQYISLDPTARSRYLAKLQVLGLTEIEYSHILAFRPVNSTSCILRAAVNPSHRSPDNPYQGLGSCEERRTADSVNATAWCCLPATVHTCPFSK